MILGASSDLRRVPTIRLWIPDGAGNESTCLEPIHCQAGALCLTRICFEMLEKLFGSDPVGRNLRTDAKAKEFGDPTSDCVL